jgi:hypothetical protein
MKLTPIAILNKIGFANAAQKALYAASLLSAASKGSPAVSIRKAVAAKAAVIGVPAFAGRAASPAIAANAANPVIAAGALFPGSPAFAAGAAVPAFPAKPATVAIVAQPAVPAVTAITSPVIVPLPGWDGAITISKTETLIGITAYLPASTGPALFGFPTDNVANILEMTAPAIQSTDWLGALASATPTTAVSDPAVTTEQYLYEAAQALGSAIAIIEDVLYTLSTGLKIPCKKITMYLTATGYDITSQDLQLAKLDVQAGYQTT